jgi:hypothetical protein
MKLALVVCMTWGGEFGVNYPILDDLPLADKAVGSCHMLRRPDLASLKAAMLAQDGSNLRFDGKKLDRFPLCDGHH